MQREKRNSTMLTKKGISPLIATVILIGFTVALSSMVMIWGKEFITEKTEKQEETAEAQMSCLEVEFTVDKACKTGNGNEIKLMLRNLKTAKIDAFTLRSIDLPDTIQTAELESLGVLEVITKDLGQNIDTIDIVPQIKIGNDYLPCSAAAKTARIKDTCS